MTHEAKSAAPDWFKRAVSTPFEDRFIDVAGCRIHYLRWGQAGRPGLLLVHGGFAHAHWWDFIAPFFADEYVVAALDVSGMGDSGHRAKYTAEIYAQEAMQVCQDAGFAERPVVAGHSFGGLVALKAGLVYADQLAGVVLADFPVRPPDLELEYHSQRPAATRKKVYPDLPTALNRFKLIPPQPCDNEFILDHIARWSLRQVPGGWTWKFDEKLFDKFERWGVSAELPRLTGRAAVVYGEKSALFPPEIIGYMAGVLDRGVPFIPIPEAHHHLFLDQPLAFVAVMRALLAEWRPTRGGTQQPSDTSVSVRPKPRRRASGP